MKKIILLSAMALSLQFCTKNEVENKTLTASELAKDQIFVNFMQKVIQPSKDYSIYLSSLPKEQIDLDVETTMKQVGSKSLRLSDQQLVSKKLGFNSFIQMQNYFNDIEDLRNRLLQKYPQLIENKKSDLLKNATMIFANNMDEGEANCRGKYEACLQVAATGGGACIIATSGVGTFFCVIAAGAVMEACKQEYISCVNS